MISGALSNALKGIGGEFEITRVVGAAGGFAYILGGHAFLAWNMIEGRAFDLTAYCIAFPGGLGAVIVAIAGSASIKDRNVAVAKATEAKTKSDAAGDGSQAIEEAEHRAAGEVADAATDKKDEITGKGRT